MSSRCCWSLFPSLLVHCCRSCIIGSRRSSTRRREWWGGGGSCLNCLLFGPLYPSQYWSSTPAQLMLSFVSNIKIISKMTMRFFTPNIQSCWWSLVLIVSLPASLLDHVTLNMARFLWWWSACRFHWIGTHRSHFGLISKNLCGENISREYLSKCPLFSQSPEFSEWNYSI